MKNIYTIYDTVAKECNGPFLANNDSHARMIFDRAVAEAAKNGFKQEYKLLYIGIFDVETAEIIKKEDDKFSIVCSPIDVTFVLKAEDDE